MLYRELVIASLLLPLSSVSAAPGDLDTTFNGTGMVITDFGDESSAEDVVLQRDGRIVAVGTFFDTTDGSASFALARYRPNGHLDQSFNGGRVLTKFGYATVAQAGAADANGRIIAAGYVVNEIVEESQRSDFALVRYRSNGTLDASFGDNGIVTTGRRNLSGIYAVAVQPDGKIVAAGQAFDNAVSQSQFAVARYLPDGRLDRSFGRRGVVITDVGLNDFALAVALQADGRIVVAGRGDPTPGQLEFAVVRYRSNGSLDPTFGGDGIVTTPMGEGYFATGVAVRSDGKVVVAGQAFRAGADVALARYLGDGTLDPSFGAAGKVLLDLGGTELIEDVVLQPDGKALVAGGRDDPTTFERNFVLARVDTSGLLDTTFAGVGYVTTEVGTGDLAHVAALALQRNGRVVAAGRVRDSDNATHFALARYRLDLQD